MVMENFHYFALRYLDDWISDDSRFVTGLTPEEKLSGRLATLCEAATYYKVTRTLPTLEGEARLAAALQAIDSVPVPITDATVDDAVCGLATRFQESYGRYAISAASKFLWLRHRWPVVILDDRASRFLWAAGGRFSAGDYKEYRREWRLQFAAHESKIALACAALHTVKHFSLGAAMSDDDLLSLTGSNWFHDRVFDKFLWWNAA